MDQTCSAIQPLAYTMTTAAAAVGVSQKTLYREIRAGRLGCRYYGRTVLIPAGELQSWLNALPSERPD